MTTWTFAGTVLPAGERGRVDCGSGPAEALPGAFALPGLVDAHCHLSVRTDAGGPSLGDADLARTRLAELARVGVTVVRDVGGERTVTLPLARLAVEGDPRVLAAGRFFAPAGRYYPRMHAPVAPEQLVTEVAREIDDGATWIKLIGDFPATDADGVIAGSTVEPTYPLDTVAAVVALAHERGARVAAHTNSEIVGPLIAAGIDSVEHGGGLTVADLGALGALGARDGAWTPTLCAAVGPVADETAQRRARRQLRSRQIRQLLPVAAASGVRIMAGSDVVGTVAEEIALLVAHGLSMTDALAASTSGSRAYLDVRAADDLVTYDRDPRDDAAVLTTPRAVVIRGHRVV